MFLYVKSNMCFFCFFLKGETNNLLNSSNLGANFVLLLQFSTLFYLICSVFTRLIIMGFNSLVKLLCLIYFKWCRTIFPSTYWRQKLLQLPPFQLSLSLPSPLCIWNTCVQCCSSNQELKNSSLFYSLLSPCLTGKPRCQGDPEICQVEESCAAKLRGDICE